MEDETHTDQINFLSTYSFINQNMCIDMKSSLPAKLSEVDHKKDEHVASEPLLWFVRLSLTPNKSVHDTTFCQSRQKILLTMHTFLHVFSTVLLSSVNIYLTIWGKRSPNTTVGLLIDGEWEAPTFRTDVKLHLYI